MSETHYLTTEHLIRLAELATGAQPAVRDHGLLASAAERPAASMFGADLYPDLLDKAAAMMHSITRFHPLVDGNKRLAWLATAVLCELNGAQVVATNDQAYELTISVATRQHDDVPDIAKALEPLVQLP